MKDLPRAPKGPKALLISPEVYETLAESARRELIHDTDHFTTQKQGNKTTVRLRNPGPENGPPVLPPFTVLLGQNPDTLAYYVTVTDGRVVERNMLAMLAEDALIRHVCDNRLDGSGNPTKFPISVGEAIFVQVLENESGTIKGGDDVILVVDATGTISLNTIPTVQEGMYLYKLAELKTKGSGVELVPECAGSHIYHKTGLTADVILRDCPTYEEGSPEPIPGAQLIRLSFVSGTLVSVGESEEARPYAETKEETTVMYCS
jgi:hypothetical protein